MAQKKNNKKLKTKKIGPQTRPVSRSYNPQHHYLVGIGASAGGLEALRALFGSIKDPNDMSFIVVQHLAPQHRSRLVELISHSTNIPVKEAEEGAPIEVGVAYVTPPNRDVLIENGKLKLRPPHMKIGPKPSIDLFFKSLAENAGELAIGIILSGTGSDGALGIRAIKAGGGVTIAQRLDSAKYDGMPKAAKQTGLVDFDLTPEEIAKELARVNGHRKSRADSQRHAAVDVDPYNDILDTVERKEGASFSLYKQSTIRRRIDRRVVATRCDSVPEYAKYLRETPEEARLLFQDILISVTSFFRDPLAFKALESAIIERVKAKPNGGTVRAWVVGCATGEEAYSMAILLTELCNKLKKLVTIQVFATDLDEHALMIARKGIYSKASLIDMPKSLRERYFTRLDDNRFQMKSSVRDSVIFAKHNATQDPPFLNLDLASCRNVLIYFANKLQDKAFRTLHYALDAKGILFLGKSEAVPAEINLFEGIDKQAKIYRRVERKGEMPRTLGRHDTSREASLIAKERDDKGHPQIDLFASMIANFAPDSVIVDTEYKIRHLYGNAGSYLNLPKGEASYVVTKLLPNELALELATLLTRANKTKQLVRGALHEIWKKEKNSRQLEMAVAPLMLGNQRSFLVLFELKHGEKNAKKNNSNSPLSLSEQLSRTQKDLLSTRQQLQTIVEEQETSNEELQSLNEELQSANEELQSSNEELETANEELQSTNEELTTLNQELNVKTAELQALNQTLQAVQSAIIYPLLVLDANLKLVNFNPAARYLFRFTDQDLGTHMRVLPSFIELSSVVAAVEGAMKKSGEVSMQIKTKDRSFEVQIQVFRGSKDAIQGTVVSFVDNTEVTNALTEARLIKSRLSDILDNTPALATMKDTSGVIVYANRRFCDLVGSDHGAIVGQTDEEIFGQDLGDQLRERDYEVIKKRKALQFEERIELNGKIQWWASSKFPLLDAKKRVQSVCTISLDVTEQVQHQIQLERFKKAVSLSNAGIMIFEAHGAEFVSTFISDNALHLVSGKASILEGQSLAKVLHKALAGQEQEHLKKITGQMISSPTFSTMERIADDEHGERWIEIRSCLLKLGDEGKANHLILTLIDLTQKIKDQKTIAAQQEEVARFGRFATMGEVAAGIAHEINTPLNVITVKTDFIRKLAELEKLNKEKAVKASLDIDQMAKNISSIVMGLKSMVRKDSAKSERANMNQLVRDTLKVCEYRLNRFGVACSILLPPHDVIFDCHAVQISQILINLVNNSIDAIGHRTSEKWLTVELKETKSHIRLIVTDCGNGIDKGLAEKIMTPFFTTKTNGQGTGIGLSLSRTIARNHGGDLVLDVDNKNTSFCLELPKYVE